MVVFLKRGKEVKFNGSFPGSSLQYPTGIGFRLICVACVLLDRVRDSVFTLLFIFIGIEVYLRLIISRLFLLSPDNFLKIFTGSYPNSCWCNRCYLLISICFYVKYGCSCFLANMDCCCYLWDSSEGLASWFSSTLAFHA